MATRLGAWVGLLLLGTASLTAQANEIAHISTSSGYVLGNSGGAAVTADWQGQSAISGFTGYGPVRRDGRCLTGAGPAGQQLRWDTCRSGDKSQIWALSGSQLNNELGWCADVEGNRAGAGVRVLAWQCSRAVNQQFKAHRAGDSQQAANLPDWTRRDERCFGAVGNACGGFVEAVALSFNLRIRILSLGAVNTAAVGCIPLPGQSACWVSSGSIKHDNCCVRNPNGVACGGKNSETTCSAEWDEAVRASARGRVWVQTFDASRGGDLTPADSPRNRYAGGEVRESARLCAPAGTPLDDNQVAFCCSGAGVRYEFLGDRWLQCTDRALMNTGVVPATKPPGVLVPNQENMRKLLSGVPRESLEVPGAKPAGR